MGAPEGVFYFVYELSWLVFLFVLLFGLDSFRWPQKLSHLLARDCFKFRAGQNVGAAQATKQLIFIPRGPGWPKCEQPDMFSVRSRPPQSILPNTSSICNMR